MDANNGRRQDVNAIEEAETKRNNINNRIRKAQVEVKNVERVSKGAKKNRNAELAKPSSRPRITASSAGILSSDVALKRSEEKHNEVARHLKALVSRAVQDQEIENGTENQEDIVKKPEPVEKRELVEKKEPVEKKESELMDRSYIKFIDNVVSIEKGSSINSYYLSNLLNVGQTLKAYEAFKLNSLKNRNPDVFCIDETRVKQSLGRTDFYIHANHIKFERLTKTYIATQHPLQGTMNDFWTMIADHKVDIIVSLTKYCAATSITQFPIYFPNFPGPFRAFGQFFVYCRKVVPPTTEYECTEYTLEIVDQTEKYERRNIQLLQYPHWAQNALPASTKVILNIVKRLVKKSEGPVVVQCETGVNQSAELIFVDGMCSMLANNEYVNFDSMFRQMRNQKAQTMTQRLHFLHSITCVLEFIKNSFKPLPESYSNQLEPVLLSLSKDFSSNTSAEPMNNTPKF